MYNAQRKRAYPNKHSLKPLDFLSKTSVGAKVRMENFFHVRHTAFSPFQIDKKYMYIYISAQNKFIP